MVKAELIKRSPLRILDKSIHGGLGAGNLGVVASAKGVGKTACLVHLATDQLLQGKHVIHVSFAERTDHIITWYEGIFKEIAKNKNLADSVQVHDDLIKNRVIMSFRQDGVSEEQIRRSLDSLIAAGGFNAEVIVVDGYDFKAGKPEFLKAIKDFAASRKLQVWFTADVDNVFDKKGVPGSLETYMDNVAVLVTLSNTDSKIRLKLVKDHERYVAEDLHLALDPRTMLIDGD